MLKMREQVRQRHQFVVFGYVGMPEHVHLLFSEPELSEPERGNPSLVLVSCPGTMRQKSGIESGPEFRNLGG